MHHPPPDRICRHPRSHAYRNLPTAALPSCTTHPQIAFADTPDRMLTAIYPPQPSLHAPLPPRSHLQTPQIACLPQSTHRSPPFMHLSPPDRICRHPRSHAYRNLPTAALPSCTSP